MARVACTAILALTLIAVGPAAASTEFAGPFCMLSDENPTAGIQIVYKIFVQSTAGGQFAGTGIRRLSISGTPASNPLIQDTPLSVAGFSDGTFAHTGYTSYLPGGTRFLSTTTQLSVGTALRTSCDLFGSCQAVVLTPVPCF